ncbi:Short-chain dehydrogenase/reductase SDR [Verrucomicrobia bacterium]|nr:Short-chain dehydrogenase/reductase SDR [Verrucomicrobiota bacterium]
MHPGKPEVVAVTGASAGVGRATVQAFAKRGARIGLLARGIKGLEGAKREAEQLGGQALVLPIDVAHADQVEAAAEKIEETFGPLDVWINAAMVSVFSPFKEMTAEEFRRVTEVTYLGTVYGTMAALKRMVARDQGTIVQVGSALAYRSIPLQAAYCGAKHAVRGFTDSLRCELLHDQSGVWVTMVQLPAVNTPQFSWVKSRLPRQPQPVPPIYQPEIPAEAIYWAAHHRRRELFVGTSALKAIEGNKLIPGMLDRYLAKTGYSSQQTDGHRDPDQGDNLWKPLDDQNGIDYGAHGRFDARARTRSPELWASRNREWLGVAAASLAGLGIGLNWAAKKSKKGNSC